MIQIVTGYYSKQSRIIADGMDRGMVQDGLAYAQGMTPEQLEQTAQAMREAAKAGKGRGKR